MIVRKPLAALALLSLTLVLTVGAATPAGAAQTCDGPFPPESPPTCFTTSSDMVTVEQPVPGVTEDVETFQTRVIVQTTGGTTFDQTVDGAADSPAAADAVVAARAAATAAGLTVTDVVTSAPERSLVSSTPVTVVTPDREELSSQTELFIGPDTAQVGPDRSETVFVPSGATLFNTNTRTTRYVNVATNTTNTYRTTATITITAGAGAAQTCESPTGVPDLAFDCFTHGTQTVTVEQSVPDTTTNNETFRTRVVVQGPGGMTSDQSVDAESDSPAVADVIVQAKAAAAAAGLQISNVDTSAPQRALVNSTQVEVTTADHDDTTPNTVVTFGPDTIQVGQDLSQTLFVPPSATNYNTITTTTHYVNVATNTTNTYRTTVTVTITAVAPVSTMAVAARPAGTSEMLGSAASPNADATASGDLARTGSSTGPSAALGIALLLAGAGCIHLSRRTASRKHRPAP